MKTHWSEKGSHDCCCMLTTNYTVCILWPLFLAAIDIPDLFMWSLTIGEQWTVSLDAQKAANSIPNDGFQCKSKLHNQEITLLDLFVDIVILSMFSSGFTELVIEMDRVVEK